MGCDLVVLGLPLQQRGQGRFLGGLDDLRVVLYQSTVDTFRLHLDRLGFRRQVVADKQGRAVVKTDRHIAGAAPFAGTGGRVDFAGLTAKRLRDRINFGLQGQVFVSVSDFHRLFLQLRQGFGGGRLRLGVGSNFRLRGGFRLRLRHGFLFRLRLWCRFLFRGGFLCRLLLFLGIQLLDGFLRQLPGIELIHQLPAPFRRPDIQHIPDLGPAVILRDIGLQHIQVFPAVAAGVGVYPVEVVRLGLFLCRLRPLLPAAVALQLRGLDAGKGLNTSDPVRRIVGIVVQKPLPCAHTWRPAETVFFQLLAGVRFRLAVKEHLQAALIPVGLHMAAVKLPAHIGHFICAGQAFDPLTDTADFCIVIGQLPALKRLLFIVPAGRHIRFQIFEAFRREVRAAVQRTVFAVIGIDRFHGFLRLFQTGQLLLQLGNGLRVVLSDAAHAGAADFIKQPLDVLPFLHIAVAGRVLFLFLAYREIGTTGNQNGRNTGVNLIAMVHVGGQFPRIGVKQAVDLLMVHGIDALFLFLCQRKGFIHIMPVFGCGAAGLVVGKAVHFLGTAGRALIDGIVVVGRRRFFCLLFRGFLLGRLFDLLRLGRGLIASRRIFLYGHTGIGGLLCNFRLHLRFVVLQALVEVGQFRHFRQRLSVVEQRTALHSVVHQRPIVGGFLRRQGVAGRQTGLRLLFQPGQVAMQLHVGDDLGEKGFPAGVILRPCLRAALSGQMVFPFFIVEIKGLILPDMLNQGTVPVAKILPPGIAVRLSLECKINAEVGLVIVAAAPMFCVQPGKQGVGLMQRHLLAHFQIGAFGEKDRHNRLCRGVKGGLLCGLGLCDFPVNPAFHQLVHMAVLHFIAMFAKLIDKGNHLVCVVHGLGVLHNQPAFLVAHALSVTLGPVDQSVGPFRGGGLRHNGLVVQKAVNPIPRLRLRLGLGPLQRPVAGKDKALCLNGVQRALRHLAGGFHIGVNQGLQHGFYTVGHFLLLFRGQLGKHTVGGRLLGGLFHGLLRLPLLLKLGKVAVDGGNQLMGGGPDGFKGRPQLFQVFAGTPTGHIPKGIVGRVQPVVLADGIGHALGLHLAGAAVGPVGLLGHRGLRVNGVELGMGNLMDGCFQSLQLTHVLLYGDPLFRQVVVAVRSTGDVLKGHRDGGSLFQRLEEVLVLLHTPGQLVHTDRGQRFALGLAHVKDRHDLERRNLDFFFLGDGVAVLVHDRLALFVQLRHFLFHLVGGGGQNLDAFLAPLHIAVKIVPPLVVARHKLAALHGDQQRIVEAVTVELRHRGEIGFVAFTLEKLLYAGFQPVGDLFHAVGAVLAVENDRDDGRRGRSFGGGCYLWLHRPGRGLVPQNFRRGIGHHPVFLRHRLALMDTLPLVAAFHQIAVVGENTMLRIGNMQAETGQENSRFPFLRHIHHAGTVQVVVTQLARAGDIRQMHIVVHVVGVVDDLSDAVEVALRACQGGVQLRKLGGVQLFQPRGKEVQFVHIGGQHQIAGQLNGTLLRASVVVQEKVLRIVGTDPDFPQGFLQLFGCGRQRKPKALFALLITLSVMKQDRKHFAHLVAPF